MCARFSEKLECIPAFGGVCDTQVALDKPKPNNYDEDLGQPKPDVISNEDLQAHLSLVTQEITMDQSHVFHQPNIWFNVYCSHLND